MTLLGQLAAGVAHEVRNPLNAILAVAEALFQDIKDIGDNPDYYKPFLDHIRTQVDRLSNLMGDLLDLGKPILPSGFLKEHLPEICAATIDLWKQTALSHNYKVLFLRLPEKITSMSKPTTQDCSRSSLMSLRMPVITAPREVRSSLLFKIRKGPH